MFLKDCKVHRKIALLESLFQLSRKPEGCNFMKKESLAQVFSCEFFEISKNTFFYRTHPVATSDKQNVASDIGLLFSDLWSTKIIIWFRYFHAISPNYTSEENLQTRIGCLMFLKTHAYFSDMH